MDCGHICKLWPTLINKLRQFLCHITRFHPGDQTRMKYPKLAPKMCHVIMLLSEEWAYSVIKTAHLCQCLLTPGLSSFKLSSLIRNTLTSVPISKSWLERREPKEYGIPLHIMSKKCVKEFHIYLWIFMWDEGTEQKYTDSRASFGKY